MIPLHHAPSGDKTSVNGCDAPFTATPAETWPNVIRVLRRVLRVLRLPYVSDVCLTRLTLVLRGPGPGLGLGLRHYFPWGVCGVVV